MHITNLTKPNKKSSPVMSVCTHLLSRDGLTYFRGFLYGHFTTWDLLQTHTLGNTNVTGCSDLCGGALLMLLPISLCGCTPQTKPNLTSLNSSAVLSICVNLMTKECFLKVWKDIMPLEISSKLCCLISNTRRHYLRDICSVLLGERRQGCHHPPFYV